MRPGPLLRGVVGDDDDGLALEFVDGATLGTEDDDSVSVDDGLTLGDPVGNPVGPEDGDFVDEDDGLPPARWCG